MATKITADRFNNLKARVRAECLRRAYAGTASGSKSVSSYGGTSYDYSTTPAKGGKILAEHRNKLSGPLNAINSNTITSATGGTYITDAELTTMEAFVTTLEKQSITNYSSTNCSGGCTGLCYGCTGTCYNACSGCTDTCRDDCSGYCDAACESDCVQGCSGSCSGDCADGCSSTCSSTGR